MSRRVRWNMVFSPPDGRRRVGFTCDLVFVDALMRFECAETLPNVEISVNLISTDASQGTVNDNDLLDMLGDA